MQTHDKTSKIIIGKRIQKTREALTEAEIILKSQEIEKKFYQSIDLQNVKNLLIYMATKKEVQTRGIINICLKKNIKTYLPVVDTLRTKIFFSRVSDVDDLIKGPFGIYQPSPKKENLLNNTNEIDLIIVPGLVFDKKGGRIGSGKGYYDKFLGTVPSHKLIIALAFEFQIVDEIKQCSHDIPVHKIITEKRIVSCV